MADTTIGTSATQIGSDVSIIGSSTRVGVVVSNTGATAFNSFKVQWQKTSGGAFRDWIGGSDFAAAAAGITPWISGTPVTLAGGAAVDFDLLPGAAIALRFIATVASGSTTANIAVNQK